MTHNWLVEKEEWVGPIRERFGLPANFFDDFVLLQLGSKTLNIANSDIMLIEKPEPASIGMPFLHIKMASPKLTSAAAMWLGPHCTRSVVELNTEEANAFLRRETNVIDLQHAQEIGRGYVMVRHGQDVLGLGFLWDGARAGEVESFVPRAWAIGEAASIV